VEASPIIFNAQGVPAFILLTSSTETGHSFGMFPDIAQRFFQKLAQFSLLFEAQVLLFNWSERISFNFQRFKAGKVSR
jgi:hypothetical protein